MVKAETVIARSSERATRQSLFTQARLLPSLLAVARIREVAMTGFLMIGIFMAGCSAPVNPNIPSIPKDHPANKFYQAAQQGMLSDRVCRDDLGDPAIPFGKIQKGDGYIKTADLTAGVFRFRETATGKKYLGVSFLQYNGFLQIPKVCAWEEKK